MCDYTKAFILMLLSLVLLFAVLPGEVEARPRITNSDTNSVDSPTPIQEISQEDDEVVTLRTPQQLEEVGTTAAVDISRNYLYVGSKNRNQTKESTKDEIQNEADVKPIDLQSGNIRKTSILPVDITSSDNIDIPIEFPSERNNLFTILDANDFPILSRKLRGENLGYFENPIESTDSTYSHVPIEFPTQSNSDIQILYSKDHPIFTNFLANKNKGRSLSHDLEEGSGNFDEQTYEEENKDFITNEKEINVDSTTEPELTTDIAFKTTSESNSEAQQVEETEKKSTIYTEKLILPTNESYVDDSMIKSQTNDSVEIFEDLYSQKHNIKTNTDEPSTDITELVEIELHNVFSTPFPELSSKVLLTTIPKTSEKDLLESESTLLVRHIEDNIGCLVGRNEEDYFDKIDNVLNEDDIGRIEEPVNFSKHSIKITDIAKLNSPGFSTDQPRNERMFDNDELLMKGNNSEVLISENLNSTNSDKLGEEENSTVPEDLNSTLSIEVTVVTTNFPELRFSENSLKSLMLDEHPYSNKTLSAETTGNFLKEPILKNNFVSSTGEEDMQFYQHSLDKEESYPPTEKSTEITASYDEDFQTTPKMDSFTEITAFNTYPENITLEYTENIFSQNFDSTTPQIFDDKQFDATTEFKNEDHYEISERVENVITTSKNGLLSEKKPEDSTEDFDSKHQNSLFIEPLVHPTEDVASIVDSTVEDLEINHYLKNFEEESNSGDELLGNGNDFEKYLQNISENIKTETDKCCASINEEQLKIVNDEDKIIPTITSLHKGKIDSSARAAIENYENTKQSEDTVVPDSSTSQNLNPVKTAFKFDEVSGIIAEEETAEKLLKDDNDEPSKINTKHDSKPVFEGIETPRKADSFETNDNINKILGPKLQSQKGPNVFSISKKKYSSEEASSSEEHLNSNTEKNEVHLNTPVENKSSSESVESYEISYFPSQKKFPFKTAYQGRAFSDASEDFTELLQPFRKISVEEASEFVSTDHSVIKRPGALDSTFSSLIFTEESSASPIEKEGLPSSNDDVTRTTLPSFTEMIVEAATLTTELNHEIESFRTSEQTTQGVFEETVATTAPTISTEMDKQSLGDALPTRDMKNTVVASDISLSAILIICMIGIVVVLALLVTTWYKIRNSGNTFDIQLEEQRHRKEQGSQTISISE